MKPLIAITGASSGIGAALAASFAADGYPLLLLARRVERMAALALPNTQVAGVDVSDLEQLKHAVKEAEAEFGPVDCFINNAGLMQLSPFVEQEPQEWEDMLSVNVVGVMNGCRVALESMLARDAGTIINMSSIAGRKAFPNHAGYVATKFAVHGLTENIRQEVAGANVRVSVVAPGAVETELLSHSSSERVISDYEAWKASIGGALEPAAIVAAVRYIYNQPQSVCVREVVVANTGQEL